MAESSAEEQLSGVASTSYVPDAPAPAPAPPAESSVGEVTTTTEKILNTTLDASNPDNTTTPPPPYQDEVVETTEPATAVPLSKSTTLSTEEEEAKAEAAKDCAVSDWLDWSGCGYVQANELKGVVQTRKRVITNPQSDDGAVCPPLTEVRECDKFGGNKQLLKAGRCFP